MELATDGYKYQNKHCNVLSLKDMDGFEIKRNPCQDRATTGIFLLLQAKFVDVNRGLTPFFHFQNTTI
jgi:hypothetical protein